MIRRSAIWHWIDSKWRRLLAAIALTVYIGGGSLVAVGSGITVDDPLEQFTFRKIIAAAGNLLTGHIAEYKQLQSYGDRYYGIGFDTFAWPFQLAFGNYISRVVHIDLETARQLAVRPAILVLFGISIVVFYQCLRFFVRERSIALAMSAWYAANPYLFGHAMINARDSPFMSIYLLCTYLSLKLVKLHLGGGSGFSRHIFLLAAATAGLASIRIPGLMILVQYAFTFVLADASRSTMAAPRLCNLKNVTRFFAVLMLLVVLAFPAVWLNPVREIAAGLKFCRLVLSAWLHVNVGSLHAGVCNSAIRLRMVRSEAAVSDIGRYRFDSHCRKEALEESI
jgi:hypothetical protein